MRILFVLSQRPELTGSGVTLDALVREARRAGHEVRVLCGIPAGTDVPEVGGLASEHVAAVRFGEGGDLDFPVPGMSDVMPYRSTVWSTMGSDSLQRYRRVWKSKLAEALDRWAPDLVHLNHLWVVSALAPEVLAGLPSVVHGHATGLRQMELCPGLREEVVAGLRAHRDFVVLHAGHAEAVVAALGVEASRVHRVGAGYREDLFHSRGAPDDAARRGRLLYVGKYAAAKGLPWLLDAVEKLPRGSVLHVAGDGAGEEAERLRARMRDMTPRVVLHGRLDQDALGGLMRRCSTLVLPSFYEGLPLVLAEARACGCRLVCTDLEGVRAELAPAFGERLELVPLPRLARVDRPLAEDLPRFVEDLGRALEASLERGPEPPRPEELAAFTWRAVFERVERVWTDRLESKPRLDG